MAEKHSMLTQESIKKILKYDPDTGFFTWLVTRGSKAPVGGIAGSKHSDGYMIVSMGGKHFRTHRLAWLYVYGEWPTSQIDHINGCKSDNRIANLRLASCGENNQNMRVRSDNTSGYIGVFWSKQMKKWCARIYVSGQAHHVGLYSTADAAGAAYAEAKARLHTFNPVCRSAVHERATI